MHEAEEWLRNLNEKPRQFVETNSPEEYEELLNPDESEGRTLQPHVSKIGYTRVDYPKDPEKSTSSKFAVTKQVCNIN